MVLSEEPEDVPRISCSGSHEHEEGWPETEEYLSDNRLLIMHRRAIANLWRGVGLVATMQRGGRGKAWVGVGG